MLYIHDKLYDVIKTWKVNKAIRDTPAVSAQINKSDQINITLKEIFNIISKSEDYNVDELVIADLTCSVFTDQYGNEIELGRHERLLSRRAEKLPPRRN